MTRVEEVYQVLLGLEAEKTQGVSARDISNILGIDRSNVSRYLNILYKEKRLEKIESRPVLYKSFKTVSTIKEESSLDKMVGASNSLYIPIEKAKSAIMYPPKGLHTLILGETGVGKSMFAELMYQYARESKVIDDYAPFVRFNCADYVDNPSLLTAQIFGVKKGAYTGAHRDKDGLLKEADKGYIFLDEVHRLPPQGQEMLFTYIDNGFFRPLGETENLTYVDVRIITATTEDPKSHLLKTFSRRIPMVIRLPPIKERSLSERYLLIETFIKEESHRIGKSIYINKNSIISYLLYDCRNNIGQLKSDIQLACAKAFLNYKSEDNDYIVITQGDLPNHVRKGIMNINKSRDEIDKLLRSTQDVLKFNQNEEPGLLLNPENNSSEDFYNTIEEKLESLRSLGINEEDINQIINVDIESHFEKYIGNIFKRFDKSEISNVVNKEVLNLVEEILLLGEEELKKEFSQEIYFGLSFHLERSIERIRQGEKIYNPKLNFIRINYEKEFLFAMKVANLIDSRFNIETPVDEIGYLAMFFAADSYKIQEEESSKVGVIVAMHGRSTASSMVEVANSLIGTEHAIALDMPLTMKPETMYKLMKEKVKEINRGNGVILLVDMGSLTTFGDMIWEETGIEVKTIDMVSTPTVLKVLRKAILNYSLEEISLDFNNKIINEKNPLISNSKFKRNIIITACFTGDGAAKKIANIVREELEFKDIDIITINIIDCDKLENRILKSTEEYNILAIIGTVQIDINCIPFIPAIDILKGQGIKKVEEIVDEEIIYLKIGESLTKHLTNINGEEITRDIKCLIYDIEYKMGIKVISDVKMGIVLHISFLIDNLLNGVVSREFENLEEYIKTYSKEMETLRKAISTMEKKYKISIGEDELAYILKLFISNKVSV